MTRTEREELVQPLVQVGSEKAGPSGRFPRPLRSMGPWWRASRRITSCMPKKRTKTSYSSRLVLRRALANSLQYLWADLAVTMLEQVILNCLQGSSSEHASEPAKCPVLQSAFQTMQKVLALDQEQGIEIEATDLPNFLPQSLKWEIRFMSLMLSWKDVVIQELHTAISDDDIMVSSHNGHDRRLSPIQLYFHANEVATALLACARQHVNANESKIQQMQLRNEWMTHSENLEQQLGTISWIGSPDSIKAAFGRVETSKGQYVQSLGSKNEENAAEKYMATDLDGRMQEGTSKLVCSLIVFAIK